MRFPHIIAENTRIAYTPSPAALELEGEVNRKVKPEDFEWDKDLCPALSTLCIEAIAKNFKNEQLLDELPCEDRLHLLEILPTDLELEMVVPLIEDEIYWKRRYSDKFGVVKDPKHLGWTWKCLYLEKHVQKMVEEAQPQYSDEDNMDDILKLLNPYIHKLMVTELQSWKPPLTWDKQDIPSVYPIDHIDLNPILQRLDLIEELDITYGMKSVETEFTWNMFKMSVVDCKRLGKAILPLKLLKIFRLHRCAVDDEKVRALAQNLIKHKTITELDLSHCLIGDQGALCIAKLMLTQPTIKKIILADNKIADTGAVGIGFALLQDECCSLVHLDLRLNPLRHDGVMGIFRALVRGDKPEELNLSACQFEEETAVRLCQVLTFPNVPLKLLDVSCNWFDENSKQEILNSMMVNKTLHWLDLRDTDIPHETIEAINKLLLRNRLGLEDLEEMDGSEELAVLEVEDDLEEPKTGAEKQQGNDSSDDD